MDTATAYDLLLATPAPKFKVDFTAISTLPNEITFSRAGNAMMADATGALTWAPNNQIINSGDLSNTSFGHAGLVTVTGAYALAPDGTNSETLVEFGTPTNDQLYRDYTTIPGSTVMHSVWLYATGTDIGKKVRLYIRDGTNGTFPFETTVTLTGTNTRYSVVGTLANNTTTASFRLYGDTASSFIAWGAQAELVTYQTTPGPYVATTSAAYYGPRFDNTLGTANSPLGLLIEEARTNVALWNRDLTNAAWTLGATMTRAKNQIGIDGVANSASSITGGAVSATNTILQAITLTSSARFQSAYVKRLVGTGVVNMTLDGGTTWTAITVTSAYTRVTIPTQTLANPSVGFQVMTSTDSIAVDFVQNENGTFATSPIFTTTAAVTRAADVGVFAGLALTLLKGAKVTVVAEVSRLSAVSGSPRIIATAAYAPIYVDTSSRPTTYGLLAGAPNVLTTAAAVVTTSPFRLGVSWSSSQRSIVGTGTGLNTDAGTSIGTLGTIYLGSENGSAAANGPIAKLAIYNKRLPDLTLKAKTALGAPL